MAKKEAEIIENLVISTEVIVKDGVEYSRATYQDGTVIDNLL